MKNKDNNAGTWKEKKERAIKNRVKKIQEPTYMANRSTKKGLLLPYLNTKLTPTEREIADYLAINHYTPKQIRIIKRVSRQAVSKIIRKLEKKGAINSGLQLSENFKPTGQPNSHLKRLHGQEWDIQILVQDHYYQEILKKENVLIIDGHIVKLNYKSIEIYGGKGVSFIADTEQKATSMSFPYWFNFFVKLENKFKITLLKSNACNIKIVCQHYGNDDEDFVNYFFKRGLSLKVYAREDGKLWCHIDESFGIKEREHTHPKTGKQDSERVSKQLDDWRENDPSTNSQLDNKDKELEKRIKELEEKIKSLFDKDDKKSLNENKENLDKKN